MSWIGLVALIFGLGAAWRLGAVVAARWLGVPTRLSRAAAGTGIGLVAVGLPLLWLPRILPVGAAFVVVTAAAAVGALWLGRRAPGPAKRDDPRLLAGLIVAASLAYLSALAFWFAGTVGGQDVATLYLHSGLATGIARGNFPVVNPFEPDFALQYRVTLHTLAAAAIDLLAAPTRSVMPHVVAATAVIAVLTVYGAVARVLRPGWALSAGVLAYSWGPLYWMLAPAAIRERGLADVLGVVAQDPATIAWSGVLLGGPFTMPTHNPTVIHGTIAAVVALLILWRAATDGPWWLWLVGAAALTYLGASNEFLILTLPVGLAAALAIAPAARRLHRARSAAGLAGGTAVALLLNQTTSGVLAGLFGADGDVGRLRPGLNSDHIGQLASWGYNSSGPFAAWPLAGRHDTPIVSLEFLVDGGLLFWLVGPALLWVLARRGRSAATPWALVALANVAVTLVFRLDQSSADLYRVLHAGLTLAVPALALAAAEAFARLPRGRRLATVGASATGLILSGGFLLSALAWPGLIAAAQAAPDPLSPGTRDFLREQTVVTDRLLVLYGVKTAYLLYDGRTPRSTAYVSAETGQFIPYGYHALSHADLYAERYGLAQRELPDATLASLGIRWILAEPLHLTGRQADEIGRKLADGRLREAYRDPTSGQVIYAVRTP